MHKDCWDKTDEISVVQVPPGGHWSHTQPTLSIAVHPFLLEHSPTCFVSCHRLQTLTVVTFTLYSLFPTPLRPIGPQRDLISSY